MFIDQPVKNTETKHKFKEIVKFNVLIRTYSIQKQPSRGVPTKRCSENMQQIYRRTPMPKRDFNKVIEILQL